MEEIKLCKKHGMTRFISKNAKRTRCAKCSVEAVKLRRKRIKQKAVDLLGGKCSNCGYSKSLNALQFHHLDPSKKELSIARQAYTLSWNTVLKELDKCILLCANCHAELHSHD